MECIKCGSQNHLGMYPLDWEEDGNTIGFIFVCDKCQDNEDLRISWSIEDGEADTEEEAN